MLEECGEIVGLDIYTDGGIFVGKVDAIAFDTDSRSVGSLIVERPNPAVAEDGVILGIPYSWVSAVGDVVLLKGFPGRVSRDGTVSPLRTL